MSRTKDYEIIDIDPWLAPYKNDIHLRMSRYSEVKNRLLSNKGTVSDFANGFLYFGFHKEADGWVFREWLPGADDVHLIGDFNGWDRESAPLHRLDNGVWSPDE